MILVIKNNFSGYRHIRLLSSMGEPMENATLFVHVSISNKRGGVSSFVNFNKNLNFTSNYFKIFFIANACK